MSNLIERAKQYNQQLKAIESQASDTKAHISYGEADLNKLCKELSSLLGIEVTEDNVETICEQQMAKIMNDLETGERTIKAIKEGTYSQQELERTIEMKEEAPKEEFERHSHFTTTQSHEEPVKDSSVTIDLTETLDNLGGVGSIMGGRQTQPQNNGGININNIGIDLGKTSVQQQVPNSRILDI